MMLLQTVSKSTNYIAVRTHILVFVMHDAYFVLTDKGVLDNFWPFSKDASSTLPWPQVFVLKPLEERYSVVDMLAGKAAITRAFRAKHLHAATLDLVTDPRDELWLNMCIIV